MGFSELENQKTKCSNEDAEAKGEGTEKKRKIAIQLCFYVL